LQSAQGGSLAAGLGQALGVVGGKVDDEVDHRDRLVGKAADAEAAHFDHARELIRRAGEEAPVARLDLGAIVGDEAGEAHEAARCCGDQGKREPGFARPGWAADENRARTDKDG
jgi:hypothetical protein